MSASGIGDRLDALFAAVRVLPGPCFSWLGRRIDVVSPDVEPDRARRALVTALTHRLYEDFYRCGGVGVHEGRTPAGAGGPATEIVKEFDGRRRPDPEWTVVAGDGPWVIERGGIHVTASAGELHDPPRAPAAGDEVAVSAPLASADAEPGWVIVVGEQGPPRHAAELARVYWNVAPEAAPALATAVLAGFDLEGLRFRLKVLASTGDYPRCDAGVLYLERTALGAAGPIVADALAEVAHGLGRRTPSLTWPLAPGVGFAADPGGGRSFGRHRMGLVADALVDAGEGAGPDVLRAAVGERLVGEGIDPATPWLGPGWSRDEVPAL